MRVRAYDDGGQIAILMVVFCAVAAGLVMVAADASLVFLGRQRLASAVDGAAVRAAQQLDHSGYFGSESCLVSIPLSQSAINVILAAYATNGITLDGEPASVDGGPGVVVSGTLVVDLPDVPVIGLGSWRVDYSTQARSSISGAGC